MIVANGTIQTVSINAKGGTDRVDASYTVTGTTLQQTGTCGFTDSFSESFSVTGSTMTLIQAAPPFVSVFTRQ
jgi:hypothetical protein